MGCDKLARIPGICVPLVSGLFTVLQKLIQLLLEVWLCTAFERSSWYEVQGGERGWDAVRTLSRTSDITLPIVLKTGGQDRWV